MKNHPIPVLTLCTIILLSGCGQKPAAPSSAEGAASSSTQWTRPAGLPPCPELLASLESTGTPQAGSINLLSEQSPAAILEFYSTALAANGWVLGTSIKQGGDHHLLFRQGSRFLRMQIGPSKSKGESALHLIWGQMDGGEPVRDSYEPDFEGQPEEDDGGGRGW